MEGIKEHDSGDNRNSYHSSQCHSSPYTSCQDIVIIPLHKDTQGDASSILSHEESESGDHARHDFFVPTRQRDISNLSTKSGFLLRKKTDASSNEVTDDEGRDKVGDLVLPPEVKEEIEDEEDSRIQLESDSSLAELDPNVSMLVRRQTLLTGNQNASTLSILDQPRATNTNSSGTSGKGTGISGSEDSFESATSSLLREGKNAIPESASTSQLDYTSRSKSSKKKKKSKKKTNKSESNLPLSTNTESVPLKDDDVFVKVESAREMDFQLEQKEAVQRAGSEQLLNKSASKSKKLSGKANSMSMLRALPTHLTASEVTESNQSIHMATITVEQSAEPHRISSFVIAPSPKPPVSDISFSDVPDTIAPIDERQSMIVSDGPSDMEDTSVDEIQGKRVPNNVDPITSADVDMDLLETEAGELDHAETQESSIPDLMEDDKTHGPREIIIQAGISLKVIESYQARDLDELDLEKGDIIELDMTPSSSDEYWWKGTNRSWGKRNGQQGFFPSHCVKVLNPDSVGSSQDSLNQDGEHIKKPRPSIPLRRSTGSEVDASGGDTIQEEVDALVIPEPVPPGTKVIANYPFEPTKTDELELLVGDVVVVMESPDGGWWKGMKGLNEKAPKSGWFPASLIVVEAQSGESTGMTKSSSIVSTATIQSSQKASATSMEVESEASKSSSSWLGRKKKDKKKKKKGSRDTISSPLPALNVTMPSNSSSTSTSLSNTRQTLPTVEDERESNEHLKLDGEVIEQTHTPDSLKLPQHSNNSSPLPVEPSDSLLEISKTDTIPLVLQNSSSVGLGEAKVVDTMQALDTSMIPSSLNKNISRPSPSSGEEGESHFLVKNEIHDEIRALEASYSSSLRPLSILSPSAKQGRSASAPATPFGSPLKSSNRMTMMFGHNNINNVLATPEELLKGAGDGKWQDRFDSSVIDKMSSAEKRRFSAIWELLQTERDYLRDLMVIMELFVKPLNANKYLQPKQMQTLFANLEQIIMVNLEFLSMLEAVQDLNDLNAFAEVFLVSGDRFLCYIPYCSNQNIALAKSVSIMNSQRETRQLNEEALQNPLMRKMDLNGFLIKPVQRICKYPLLIREILKNTETSHPFYADINRALERMQGVVGAVNECAKRLNGLKPVSDVQARFAEKINIANPTRFLVREDTVLVIFSNYRKTRRLFLFNDLLILARKDWRDKNHVIEKTPLKDVRVCDITEGTDGATTLFLEIEILPSSEFDTPNHYVISHHTLQDKTTWLEGYRSLVKYAVKAKAFSEVSMTSSTKDTADDDDAGGDRRAASAGGDEDGMVAKQSDFQSRYRSLQDELDNAINHVKDREAKIAAKDLVISEKDKALVEKEKLVQDLQTKIDQITLSSSASLKVKDDRIESLSRSLNDKDIRLQELESLLNKELSQVAAKDKEIQTIKSELQTKSQKTFDMETKISQLCDDLSVVKTTSEERADRIKSLQELSRKQKADYETLQKEHECITSLLTAANHGLASKKEELEQQSEKLIHANQVIASRDYDISNLKKEIEALNETLKMREETLSNRQNDLLHTQDRLHTAESELKELQDLHKQTQAQLVELQVELRDEEKKILQAETALTASYLTVEQKDIKIRSLETSIHHLESQLMEKENRFAELERQYKTTKAKLSEAEQSLEGIQHRHGQKETRVQELERELTEARGRLVDQSTSLTVKLTAKESRLVEVEREAREYKVKLSEVEVALQHLQSKFLAKETRLVETDANLGNLQSTLQQTKQRLVDAESRADDLQSRLNDASNKLKKTEGDLVNATSQVLSLEQRITDAKSQTQSLQDTISKLERDKKDLMTKCDSLEHSESLLNKEIRSLRESLKDMKSDIDKLETQKSNAMRDLKSDMVFNEERIKAVYEKEKRDRMAEIADMSRKLTETGDRLVEFESVLTKMQRLLDEKSALYEEALRRIRETESALQHEQQKLKDMQASESRLTAMLHNATESYSTLESNKDVEITQLKNIIQRREQEIDAKTRELDQLSYVVARRERELEERNTLLERASVTVYGKEKESDLKAKEVDRLFSQLDVLQTRLMDQERQNRAMEEQMKLLSSENTSLSTRITEITVNLEDEIKHAATLKKKLKRADEEQTALKESISLVNTARDELDHRNKLILSGSEETRQQLQKTTAQLENMEKELSELQERITKYTELENKNKSLAEKVEKYQRLAKKSMQTQQNLRNELMSQKKHFSFAQVTLNEIAQKVGCAWSVKQGEISQSTTNSSNPQEFPSIRKDLDFDMTTNTDDDGLALKCNWSHHMSSEHLIQIISKIESLQKERDAFSQKLDDVNHTMKEFKELQRTAESQLEEASAAFTIIEQRFKERDLEFDQERQVYVHQISQLEERIQSLVKDLKVVDTRYMNAEQQISKVDKEKVETEKSFIDLYEKYQGLRQQMISQQREYQQAFSDLEAEKAGIQAQLKHIQKQSHEMTNIVSKLENEKGRFKSLYESSQESKTKLQQMLEAANNTAKSLAIEMERTRDQAEHLKSEVVELRKERAQHQVVIKSMTEKFLGELEKARAETAKLISDGQSIREVNKDRTAQVEKVEEKLRMADQRIVEFKVRISTLTEKLKQLESFGTKMQQERDLLASQKLGLDAKLNALLMRFESPSSQLPQIEIGDRQSNLYHRPAEVDAEVNAMNLLDMVRELISYEPEFERQNEMYRKLERLRDAITVTSKLRRPLPDPYSATTAVASPISPNKIPPVIL